LFFFFLFFSLFVLTFCQPGVYYINCAKDGSLRTFQEAVVKAKQEKVDTNSFYICGSVPITSDTDITFKLKMYGFAEGKSQYLLNLDSNHPTNTTKTNLGDDWTKEAVERRGKMDKRLKEINDKVLGQVVVVPGVTIHFRALVQIYTLGILGAPSAGFTLNFYSDTTISNSCLGNSLYDTTDAINSVGSQFKISDSFVGVNKMIVNDKTVSISNSVLFLHAEGPNAFGFIRQDSSTISGSYFVGKQGSSSSLVVMTANNALTIKSNNWFNAAMEFHGPVSQVSASSEWGYDF